MKTVERMSTRGSPLRCAQMSEREYARLAEGYGGVCVACGKCTRSGVEPDARNYLCAKCGERRVFGAEWARMQGFIEVTE